MQKKQHTEPKLNIYIFNMKLIYKTQQQYQQQQVEKSLSNLSSTKCKKKKYKIIRKQSKK